MALEGERVRIKLSTSCSRTGITDMVESACVCAFASCDDGSRVSIARMGLLRCGLQTGAFAEGTVR
jgi:hypothetical protein